MEIQNQLNKEMDIKSNNTRVKTKISNVWELGDYQSVSTMLPPISSHLVKLLKIQPGESVLDVACGNGNTAITARKCGANVTGIDITSDLLNLAMEEERIAQISGIDWREGDVQDLPFEDESFDVVLSTFGHMFAANPDLATKELVRVTKKGGRIGFATWPPELAIGSIFKINSKHLPKNPNAPPSPILWGNPDVVRERLSKVKELSFERGTTIFPILSSNHFWKFMSTKYGPLIKAIEVVNSLGDPNEPESLRADFIKALDPYIINNGLNLGYLLTVAIK